MEVEVVVVVVVVVVFVVVWPDEAIDDVILLSVRLFHSNDSQFPLKIII